MRVRKKKEAGAHHSPKRMRKKFFIITLLVIIFVAIPFVTGYLKGKYPGQANLAEVFRAGAYLACIFAVMKISKKTKQL